MENAGSYSTLEGGREIDEGDFVCSRKITQSVSVNRHLPRTAPTPLLLDYLVSREAEILASTATGSSPSGQSPPPNHHRTAFLQQALCNVCDSHPYSTMTTGHDLVSPDLNIRVALGLHPMPLPSPLSLPRIGAYRNHNSHRKAIPYRSVPVQVWGGGDSTQQQH